MKNIKILTLALLASGLLFFNACKEDVDPIVVDPVIDPVDTTKITYTDDAAPILNASCAFSGCHSTGASIGSLEGYADAKAFAGFGKLIKVIKHESGVSPMPKNADKLSDEKIATIEQWLTDGLLE